MAWLLTLKRAVPVVPRGHRCEYNLVIGSCMFEKCKQPVCISMTWTDGCSSGRKVDGSAMPG